MSSSSGRATGTETPCGACKFLRRKCASDCVFALYFSSDHGPARFAAIHKVFRASNASKLLMHVPVANRHEAVMTIVYEAQARIRDPVYGCAAHIFALQQQVVNLQEQLMQVNAQLEQNVANNVRNMEGHFSFGNSSSPESSLESIDCHSFGDVVPCTRWDGDENISVLQNNNCYLGELRGTREPGRALLLAELKRAAEAASESQSGPASASTDPSVVQKPYLIGNQPTGIARTKLPFSICGDC